MLAWAILASALILVLSATRAVAPAFAPVLLGLALVGIGAGLTGWRTWDVTAPVLTFRYSGAIEGRIVGIDRSVSDALRLTLDRVVLDDVAPERTPTTVRVSLRGDQRWLVAEPGRVVLLTGHLSPSPGHRSPATSTSGARPGSRVWAPLAGPRLRFSPRLHPRTGSGSTAFALGSARRFKRASMATPGGSPRL